MGMILIATVTENGVIGFNEESIVKIRQDLKKVLKLTEGKPVIMGRKAWHSLEEHAHPRKKSQYIVVTRNQTFKPKDIEVCYSIEEALELAYSKGPDCFIRGGGEIYRQTIDLVDRLELTIVHSRYPGTVFFPEIDLKRDWKRLGKEDRGTYSFLTYRRKIRED